MKTDQPASGMSAELRAAIDRARDYVMTPQERFEQRVSFVYGLAGGEPTKDEVRRMLAEQDGFPLAEMDQLRALRAAAQGILDRMSGTLSNGKGIEADDGEKCWIVHSDDIEELRRALAPAAPDSRTIPGQHQRPVQKPLWIQYDGRDLS